MSEELKPCPFCGGEIYTTSVFNGELNPPSILIQCNTPKCGLGIFGDPYITVDENKKLWNTRAEQPTINTFEELNNTLNVGFFRNIKEDDNPFIHHCAVGDLALRYYKSGVMSFCGEEFKNITPQQAYNIIITLKDNLGG